jgi:hypothetical protein
MVRLDFHDPAACSGENQRGPDQLRRHGMHATCKKIRGKFLGSAHHVSEKICGL